MSDAAILTACPYCRHDKATPVSFTPWGGVVGPWLLSLVRCGGCQKQFNGRSGRKVERAIRMYTLAMLIVLAFVAAWMIFEYAGPRVGRGGGGVASIALLSAELS